MRPSLQILLSALQIRPAARAFWRRGGPLVGRTPVTKFTFLTPDTNERCFSEGSYPPRDPSPSPMPALLCRLAFCKLFITCAQNSNLHGSAKLHPGGGPRVGNDPYAKPNTGCGPLVANIFIRFANTPSTTCTLEAGGGPWWVGSI